MERQLQRERTLGEFKSKKKTGEKRWKIRKEVQIRWSYHEGDQESKDYGGKAVAL